MDTRRPASNCEAKRITCLKSVARKLGLVCGGGIIGLALAEIGLVVFGVSYPRIGQLDHYRGFARRPNYEFEQSKEGRAVVKFNSDGFRDKDRPTEKPAGTVRIAVVGDSFVEALQVPVEQRFTELLESGLKSQGAFGGAMVEVMNFGVSGYSTAQELMALRHCVWKYDPDIVLLAFCSGNDVRNNYKPLEGIPSHPYFVLRDGELVLDASFRTTPLFRQKTWWEELCHQVIDRSRLAQLAYHVRNRWKNRNGRMARERHMRGRKYSDAEASIELGLSAHVFRPPKENDWQNAWRVTEALIKQIDSEVRQQGARFLVVTLPTSTQVHPDSDVREDFARRLGVDDLFYPDERIGALGQKEGFSVINLCYPFVEHVDTRGVFLHGFANTAKGRGHWNADGHRLAAEVLTSTIMQLIDGSSESDNHKPCGLLP